LPQIYKCKKLLRTNWLRHKLQETSDPCIGTWITIASPLIVDVICSAGPDFVVIDAEHSPTSFETAQLMAMACESRQVSPIIRLPEVEEKEIVRSLEIGMHVVQVANIESAEMARSLVQSARYSPIGKKGLSPFTRACEYAADNAPRMTSTANENSLLAIQVEGAKGIFNIDSILDVSGIDICFIGMFDISNHLGIPGQLEHKDLRELFAQLSRKITDRGMVVGSISNNLNQLHFLIDAGVRYITHSADCHMLSSAYRGIFSLKERIKDGD